MQNRGSNLTCMPESQSDVKLNTSFLGLRETDMTRAANVNSFNMLPDRVFDKERPVTPVQWPKYHWYRQSQMS